MWGVSQRGIAQRMYEVKWYGCNDVTKLLGMDTEAEAKCIGDDIFNTRITLLYWWKTTLEGDALCWWQASTESVFKAETTSSYSVLRNILRYTHWLQRIERDDNCRHRRSIPVFKNGVFCNYSNH